VIIEYRIEVKAYSQRWFEFSSNAYSLLGARNQKVRLEGLGYKVRIVKYTQAAPKRVGVVK